MRRPQMPQGIETEYSILPQADDFELSVDYNRAVNALMREVYNTDEWMGPQIDRSYNPDFMEEIGNTASNVLFSQFLRNGSRAYNDMDAPEASIAECPNPYYAVLYDQAMTTIFQQAAQRASEHLGYELRLLKRNSDGHGHTYGCHENFCISPRLYRELTSPIQTTAQMAWATFQLVRSVLTGAGKVGVETPEDAAIQRTMQLPFQLTQRMDFLESFRESATTKNRPIIELRDQPHANKNRWQRLHYIMSDTNMCETSTFLKMGLSALMLMVLQDGERTSWTLPVLDWRDPDDFEDQREPKSTYPRIGQSISWDVDMQEQYVVTMWSRDNVGERMKLPAPDILAYYIERLALYVREREFEEEAEQQVYARVIHTAEMCLQKIRKGNWRALFGVLDWPTKRGICERALGQLGKTWEDASTDIEVKRFLRGVADHAYCRLDPERSLYWQLVADGQITRIVSESDVLHAMTNPPPGRAELRSMVVEKWFDWIKDPGDVKRHQMNIDWNIVIMDHPDRRDDEWEIKFPDPRVMVDDKMRAIIELARDPRELNNLLNALIAAQRKKEA